jgi:hypothetical protein
LPGLKLYQEKELPARSIPRVDLIFPLHRQSPGQSLSGIASCLRRRQLRAAFVVVADEGMVTGTFCELPEIASVCRNCGHV